MAYDYDALYKETPNALGKTNSYVVDFFASIMGKALRVLDIGCGQGRDALHIARLGHHVTGLDLSPSGISDMMEAAKTESLDIIGHVVDITAYHSDETYDVMLCDRTLHMLDDPARYTCFESLIESVSDDGYMILIDEPSNMQGFQKIIDAHSANWHTDIKAKGTVIYQRA